MGWGKTYAAAGLFWILSSVGAWAESFICTDAENQATSKVLGGQPAQLAQAPYQVAFRTRGGLCGGSLILPGYVLTAAHCVYDGYGRVVPAGEILVQHSSVELDRANRREIAVRAVHVAPGYVHAPGRYEHDIAILELTENAPIWADDLATPATPGLEESLTRVGSCAQAAGFGEMGAGSGATKRLQIVDLHLVDQSVCAQSLLGRHSLSAEMICAGMPEGGKDACKGDSGGALVVDTGGGIVPWLQVGVVSWGVGACGRAGSYGIYTRVSSYRDWIESVVGGG